MGTIAVLDYGMGNLHSAAKALEKTAPQHKVIIATTQAVVCHADRVVFPGVGAIRDCMAGLRERELDTALLDAIAAGKPVLGICIGMQAMMRHSDENDGVACLGIFDASVERFATSTSNAALKVPHMGWNQVTQTRPHPLWANIPDQTRFYFVHSYRVPSLNPQQVTGQCHYGQPFVAACHKDNVFAVQFHPEKSAANGLALLDNFVRWHP